MNNEFLDYYQAQLKHQREHDTTLSKLVGDLEGPWDHCVDCMRENRGVGEPPPRHDVKKRYSWAVPNDAALHAIARHSPAGVVEIGAGGGYWAGLLRGRGVDVVAYDPAPPSTGATDWHHGHAWSEVLIGDHTAVIGHANRTLLTVWPSYNLPWAAQGVELYDGDTVIYVGEGAGGCTGDDQLHTLLGEQTSCWHAGEDDCDCDALPAAAFNEVETVAIPRWFGMRDWLTVYSRIGMGGQ